MYRKEPLEQYLTDIASRSPTPGGGSVSALVGALASSLCSMSANFTLGKSRYEQFEPQLKKILAECKKCREILMDLMHEDIDAYNKVNSAYQLPDTTENEQNIRMDAIQNALVVAMEVPLKTAMSCLSILKSMRNLVDFVNPNLISDVGTAGYLANAAFHGGKLNVIINLASIKNESLIQKVRNELNLAEVNANILFKEIRGIVMKKIDG